MKTFEFTLIAIILLTGFSAGMGFANIVGYMPGMNDTPPNHILSFWQHADHYFRARMPYFGNTLLVSLLIGLILIRSEWRSITFWLLAFSLAVSIGDLIIILTKNLPLNEIIQTLDPEKPLAIDFETIRTKAMAAYYRRAVLNIASFALAIAAAVSYIKTHFVAIQR